MPSDQVTRALRELADGRADAAEALLPLVYDELRGLAADFFRTQPSGHTLQPTALVHEAYLRLVGQPDGAWQNRAHFYAVAARAMQQILMDHARRRRAAKRGGGVEKVPFDEARDAPDRADEELLALGEALEQLGQVDPDRQRIVELKYFGGLTIDEIAHVLGLSPRTVKRGWSFAKAWLHRELSQNND